jgi:hypothetical protein
MSSSNDHYNNGGDIESLPVTVTPIPVATEARAGKNDLDAM